MCLFAIQLSGATTMSKSSLLCNIPIVKRFRAKFSKSENGPKIGGFGGFWRAKWCRSSKNVVSRGGKLILLYNKQTNKQTFHLFARRGRFFGQFWHVVSYRRHIHPREILRRLIKGLAGYGYLKSGEGVPIDFDYSYNKDSYDSITH